MELVTKNFSIEHDVQFEEDQLLDAPQSKAQGGINTLPFSFNDDIVSHVSYSNDEEHNQHDLDIEVVPHENLEPNPTPIPNQWPNPKWAQNLIKEVGDGVGNP